MISGIVGRIRVYEVLLEAGLFVEVWITIEWQIGLLNPRILYFKVFMAPRVLKSFV